MKTRTEVITEFVKENTNQKRLNIDWLNKVNEQLGANRSVTLKSLGHIIPGLNKEIIVSREVIQSEVYYTFFTRT